MTGLPWLGFRWTNQYIHVFFENRGEKYIFQHKLTYKFLSSHTHFILRAIFGICIEFPSKRDQT